MCWIGLFYFLGHGLIISIDGLVDENQKAEYATNRNQCINGAAAARNSGSERKTY